MCSKEKIAAKYKTAIVVEYKTGRKQDRREAASVWIIDSVHANNESAFKRCYEVEELPNINVTRIRYL